MADSQHLYEADKVRIANEAKVRTALEQPDFAEREFEKWRIQRERDRERDERLEKYYFANAFAKLAWLAEGRELRMGRELDKSTRRIGRQRKANREQLQRLKDLSAENEELRQRIAELEEGDG